MRYVPGVVAPGWTELDMGKGVDMEMAARNGGGVENGAAAGAHAVDERPSTSSSAGGGEAQVGRP